MRTLLLSALLLSTFAACDGGNDRVTLPEFPLQPSGTFTLRLDARTAAEQAPQASYAPSRMIGGSFVLLNDGVPDGSVGVAFERTDKLRPGTYRLDREVNARLLLGSVMGTGTYRFTGGTLRVTQDGTLLRGVFAGTAEYVEGPPSRQKRWRVEGAFAAEPDLVD